MALHLLTGGVGLEGVSISSALVNDLASIIYPARRLRDLYPKGVHLLTLYDKLTKCSLCLPKPDA